MTKLIDNGFHVKLDGIKLNKEVQERIQFGIQEVILRELAARHSIGESGSGDGFAFVIPKDWLGFILRELEHAELGKVGFTGKILESPL